MESGLFLNVVVAEGAPILQLLASKDKALLVRRNSLLVLNFLLDLVNGVGAFHLQRNGFAGERFYKDLHSSTQSKNKMESGLFLNVVVAEGAPILQLLASKDKALLVRRNSLLVLSFLLDLVNGVGAF